MKGLIGERLEMGSREGRGWCWSAGNVEAERGEAGNERPRGERLRLKRV